MRLQTQPDVLPSSSSDLLIVLLALAFPCMFAASLPAQELQRKASWQTPDDQQVVTWISEWADAANVNAQPVLQDLNSRINQHPDKLLGVTLELIADFFPLTTETIELMAGRPGGSADWKEMIDPEIFRAPGIPRSALVQLQLATGCWLARNERYDDALELLGPLPLDQVVAPAELLFNRGLSQHRLLRTESCVATLERLLENEDTIPRRFSTVARLMIGDIKSLDDDSLDEVARLMQDIRRRQALHRSGKRVIDQEKAVLEKLDQMIEELEQKMQQQSSSSAQAQGGSAQPMDGESRNASGKGSGEVTEREFDEGGEWGSLPPQKRAAALTEMARDLPPHYREVIEEYFRQLARESGKKK